MSEKNKNEEYAKTALQKEKEDLFIIIRDTLDYPAAEFAASRNIPAGPNFPDIIDEENFGDWLALVLDGEIRPKALDEERNDTYDLIATFDPARENVQRAIDVTQDGIWAMMDAMGQIFMRQSWELLADYLVTHDIAKSHILPALTAPAPGSSELNPDDRDDIAEVLVKSEDEQLWFFLDDCIPHDNKDIRILFSEDTEIEPNGDISGVRELTTAITDRLYFGDTSPSALAKENLSYMKPYLPLLQHCYRPYEWSMSVPDITEDQREKLLTLIQRDDCAGTIIDLSNPGVTGILKEDAITVPAVFHIMFGSIERSVEGWLYSLDDKLDMEEEEEEY